MAAFEENTHVFIVRIWREPREIEGQAPEWRGVVEHVPSGERRYLKDLEEICVFFVAYLEALGVKFGMCWRVKQWLHQWKLAMTRRR